MGAKVLRFAARIVCVVLIAATYALIAGEIISYLAFGFGILVAAFFVIRWLFCALLR